MEDAFAFSALDDDGKRGRSSLGSQKIRVFYAERRKRLQRTEKGTKPLSRIYDERRRVSASV